MPLLEINQLVKSYSGRTVVDRFSLEIEAGEIVGLLGRNGAGKTTCFRMTMGMISPEAGQVIFGGRDVTTMPMYKHALAGVGYLSQEPSVFQRLTVEENLLAILETQRLSKVVRKQRTQELMAQFSLTHKAKDLARTCSGGERRRLEIARALVTRPRLILLDEPFAAVDPHTVEELQEEVRRLASEGIAMLVTDHNVQQTLRICDRAYIIHEGKNLRQGTPREIINDPLVREAYLASSVRGDEFDDVAFVLVLSVDRFLRDVIDTIRVLNLQKRVRILQPVGAEVKRALYQNAQLLFFATKFEGFGFPILEAQAQGTPVLAARSGSAAEITGSSALLADPDDVDDISKNLSLALGGDTLRQELARRGRENIKRFSWETTAKEVLEVYSSLDK